MDEKKQKNRNKYLIKNTLVFSLDNLGTKLISFVLVPFYTHMLSTADYGTIDLISTVAMLVIPILTLNISEAIMRFSLDEHADRQKIMSTGLLLMVAAGFVSLLVFPIAEKIERLSQYALWIYLYIVSNFSSQILLSNLRGQELLLDYSIGNILYTFSAAVLNIVFLAGYHLGVRGYFMANTLAGILTACYAFFKGRVWSILRRFSIDGALMIRMLQFSVVLIPTSFMWWIMNSSDRIMVTWMIGSSANGVYAVAYKVPTIASTLSTVFNRAWSYSAIREKNSTDSDAYNNEIYNGLVAAVLIVAAGLLMILKPFTRIYVAPEYYSSWQYTPVLIIGAAALSLGSFAATPYTVHKDSVGFLKTGAAGALANVVLNYFLIPGMGVMGAALATCISYVVVFVFRVLDTGKYIKLNVFQKKHLLGFGLLAAQACTEFIDTPTGQLLLVVEFLCMLTLFTKEWLVILKGMFRK